MQEYIWSLHVQLPRLASFKMKKITFKNMLKNKGPSIDPCGAPFITFFQSPSGFFCLTALVTISEENSKRLTALWSSP